MTQYHKIETAFVRDENFKVTGELRHPVYGDFKVWHMTEKIDGTNIRIILEEDGTMKIGGKSDNAQLHAGLFDALSQMFNAEMLKDVFWNPKRDECAESGEEFMPFQVVLYGEGYGAGIQKGGGNLSKTKTFRLFDVLVGRWWLDWKDIQEISRKLGISTVPDMGMTTLEDAVALVKKGFMSKVAEDGTGTLDHPAEGVVLRPRQTVFDRAGRRIIIKLKTHDFTTS